MARYCLVSVLHHLQENGRGIFYFNYVFIHNNENISSISF
jgi:hypothetical protein